MSEQSERGVTSAAHDRAWMWLAILIIAAFAMSWFPALDLPLGDDHQGRILGRYLLHAENFLESGWSGSHFGAAWRPYSTAPYAHHPPLPQFVHIVVGWAQGETSALAARTIGTLAGLLTVGGVAVLVRKLTSSWLAVCASVAGIAVSGYFWFFGRGSLSLVFPVAYFVVRAFVLTSQKRLWLIGLGSVGFFAALESWPTVLIIGLVTIYDLWTGNRDVAISAAIGVAVGLVLDFWWIESAAGIDALMAHVEARAERADYGVLEWLARQAGFYLRFESPTVLAVTGVSLFMGLRDRRFRPLVASSFTMVVVYAAVFHQNAWVHEYWNWRIALVLTLGMGALGAWISQRFRESGRWMWTLVTFALVTFALIPVLRLGSELYETQYVESSRAGALAVRNDLPRHQNVAWYYGGISGPRWYAWYTDLPVRQLELDNLPVAESLVLIKRHPGSGLEDVGTVDAIGIYALAKVSDLQSALP